MSARYALTFKAEEGLLRIALYLEEHFGPKVTDDALGRIEKALNDLAEMPGIGHAREDLTTDPTISFWSVPPSLIAYRHDRSPIEVLFIERGEMDWEHMLRASRP
ncbi:MAG: type II toxin-antitoxin system RelE/ParE family toxin [Planctomycetota bacterium]